MFGGLSMMPKGLVKQFLMAQGMKDPQVLEVVGKLENGIDGMPAIQAFHGTSLSIPEDAKAIQVTGQNAEDDVYLLVYTRKKAGKNLDGPLKA